MNSHITGGRILDSSVTSNDEGVAALEAGAFCALKASMNTQYMIAAVQMMNVQPYMERPKTVDPVGTLLGGARKPKKQA